MYLLAYASAVNLKSSLNSSSMSIYIQTRSSSPDRAWLKISYFIQSIDLLSLSLMRERRLYIMTISPLEGMLCCQSSLSRVHLRLLISFKLSWISLSISSFRILNISLFFIPYLCFLNSDLLFFMSLDYSSQFMHLSCKFYRIFFFSLAFFDADVLARNKQSLSFIRPYPMLLSTFLSLLVLEAELGIQYSSCSAWENTSFSVSLFSCLGVMTLIANLALFYEVLFYFCFVLIELREFKQYQAIQQKQSIKLYPQNILQSSTSTNQIQSSPISKGNMTFPKLNRKELYCECGENKKQKR